MSRFTYNSVYQNLFICLYIHILTSSFTLLITFITLDTQYKFYQYTIYIKQSHGQFCISSSPYLHVFGLYEEDYECQ